MGQARVRVRVRVRDLDRALERYIDVAPRLSLEAVVDSAQVASEATTAPDQFGLAGIDSHTLKVFGTALASWLDKDSAGNFSLEQRVTRFAKEVCSISDVPHQRSRPLSGWPPSA